MSMIDTPSPAELYDDATRWVIPSRSDPHVTYVCELKDYGGNGSCACEDFSCRFAKLLAQGITPEEALIRKLVKLRPGYRRSDALRCFHLVEAHERFNQQAIRGFANAAKITRAQARH